MSRVKATLQGVEPAALSRLREQEKIKSSHSFNTHLTSLKKLRKIEIIINEKRKLGRQKYYKAHKVNIVGTSCAGADTSRSNDS